MTAESQYQRRLDQRRLVSAAAAVLAVLAGPALSAPATAAGRPFWGFLGLAAPAETSGAIQRFANAKLSVAQAIAAAQQHADGKVVEIGIATQHGADWYKALLATGDGLHYVRIDPATGAIGKSSRPDIPLADLDAAGRRDLAALCDAKIDLAQAAAMAAQQDGGKVVSAGIEQLDGIPQYFVHTAANGKLHALIVDPTSGRVSRPR
jgi:uncharacterized membrane protein YkoI